MINVNFNSNHTNQHNVTAIIMLVEEGGGGGERGGGGREKLLWYSCQIM